MSLERKDFVWRGLDLCIGRRKTPVLTLVADETYKHLYRVQYPNGWTSSPANLTRARDAAYGHARHLLGGQTGDVARVAAESGFLVGEAAPNNAMTSIVVAD
jgi:hypothetical protein